MKILVALTYYRPHVSGLTIYVERLSRALARRGHAVTVLTSHYEPSLPSEEVMDSVRVVRAPVLARVSTGVLMPTLSYLATRYTWQNDVLSIHLPQLDASGIATRAKLFNKPSILTYHSDLILPASFVNKVLGHPAERFLLGTSRGDGWRVSREFQMPEDLADHLALGDGGNDPQGPALTARAPAISRAHARMGTS